MQIYIFNWLFLLGLFPIAFVWLRRAWRVGVKHDYSLVALKRGLPPANPQRYAMYETIINLAAGLTIVGVLVALLGFQALNREDWTAIAGSTIWLKLFASFALSRQAHGWGLTPKQRTQ